MKLINKYYPIIVGLLLIIMLATEISTARQESQTIDEGVHLAAGYSYLVKRDFRMNQEHPPLIKELAALPLAIVSHHLKSPFDYASWSDYDEWQFARDFIYDNNLPADKIIFLGRLPLMLLSLLLGFYIFKWAKEEFGVLAGLFSLGLYCFAPNIIAHARYITTDVGVTTFFFITIYYFYKYLKFNSLRYLILTAVFFGLAQASKFSAAILVPILLIMYLIGYAYFKKSNSRSYSTKNFLKTFGVIIFTCFVIVLAVYGLEFAKPNSIPEINELYARQQQILNENTLSQQNPLVQKIINLTNPDHVTGKIIISIYEKVRIPTLSYLSGFIKLYVHNYNGHTAYLLGHYSEYGWWYYFPIALAVKTPISIFILLMILLIYNIAKYSARNPRPKILTSLSNWPFYSYFMLIPPLGYFLFSLTSRLNIGYRHILIIEPFIYVGLGYLLLIKLRKRQKLYIGSILILLAYYLASSFLIYPHYLAYFNEISGGPVNGSKYLVDSNIDWGQDAKKLKKYMVTNNIDHVCLSYFGQARLSYYDIDYRYLPDNQHFQGIDRLNCVVAISLTSLLSKEREFGWLLSYQPSAKIGYSIYIYDFRQNK